MPGEFDASRLAVDCRLLSFSFDKDSEKVLEDVDLQLEPGDRCLLVGANGGMHRGLSMCRSMIHSWL